MGSPAPQLTAASRQPRVLGALRHHNYRLFFSGQVISTVGTWMQSIALPWLVLQLTNNDFLVGFTLACQFLPMLLIGPFGGLAADRFPKNRVLLATQVLYVIPAAALFLLTHFHLAQYWMVLIAAGAVGTLNVFDFPARQSFAIEMVGREDLMNAIALNSAVFNAAAVIGPAVAGVIIAGLGVELCFLINAVSFLASIAALLLMRNLPALVRESQQSSMWRRIQDGAQYALRDRFVGTMLVLLAVFSMFAMNRLTLIPLFAERVLHTGAVGYGILMGALGFGAMVGAVTLAVFPAVTHRARLLVVGVAWAALLVVFSTSRWEPLSAVLLAAAGFCQMTFIATANTRIQHVTPDNLRGRVMSLYAQAMMGVGPVGASQAGLLSQMLGPPWAMAIGGLAAGAMMIGVGVLRPEVFRAESR